MNINNMMDGAVKLYTRTSDLKHEPEVSHLHAINMISMIQKNTTVIQFENSLEINSLYKLEMKGPCGPCYGQAGLGKAVLENNLDITKYFIENLSSQSIDSISSNRQTALIKAIVDRGLYNRKDDISYEIIHRLLKAGSNVNLALDTLRFDKFNDSPLTKALSKQDFKLTKLLMQYGAEKLHAISKDGKLIKQKLTKEETELYKQVKQEIRDTRTLVFIAAKDKKTFFFYLPREIILEILTCDYVESSNRKRVSAAKLQIFNKQ